MRVREQVERYIDRFEKSLAKVLRQCCMSLAVTTRLSSSFSPVFNEHHVINDQAILPLDLRRLWAFRNTFKHDYLWQSDQCSAHHRTKYEWVNLLICVSYGLVSRYNGLLRASRPWLPVFDAIIHLVVLQMTWFWSVDLHGWDDGG